MEAAEAAVKDAQAKVDRLTKAQDPENQKRAWRQTEAYAADAWRLVANRKLCLQCHQVGDRQASNPETQGPPLSLAADRLRPDWVYRWVATPQHFLPYNSPMPIYFPANKPPDYQHLFAGSNPEQVRAVRDVLMNYPRVSSLPVNRAWRPEMAEEKKEEKKDAQK